MKNNLKSFVRLDKNRSIVPGTLVTQSHMPKVGKWKEVVIDNCCSNIIIEIVSQLEFPWSGCYTISLSCNSSHIRIQTVYGPTSAATIQELIPIMNYKNIFGLFYLAEDNTTVLLKLSTTIVNYFSNCTDTIKTQLTD